MAKFYQLPNNEIGIMANEGSEYLESAAIITPRYGQENVVLTDPKHIHNAIDKRTLVLVDVHSLAFALAELEGITPSAIRGAITSSRLENAITVLKRMIPVKKDGE